LKLRVGFAMRGLLPTEYVYYYEPAYNGFDNVRRARPEAAAG